MSGSATAPAVEPPPPDASTISSALASIKTRAVPLGYAGSPSPNLDHMKPDPATSEDSAKKTASNSAEAASAAKTPQPVDYSKQYYRELYALHKTCPGLQKTNIQDFNTAAWLNTATRDQDLREMPRQFLEAAYFTIARMPKAPEKTAAIDRLNLAMPDSPAFVEFLQLKRGEIAQRLTQDEHFKAAEQKWESETDAEKIAFLAYVGRLTLQTLLPGHDIEYPRYFVLKDSKLSPETRALFNPNYNEVYVNGSAAGTTTFHKMVEHVIHETTHTFQNILAAWYIEEELPAVSELRRQAKLYYIANLSGGSGIPAEENYRGYRAGFDERLPWALQLALRADKSERIETDFFLHHGENTPAKIADPPVYKTDPKEGTLPAACLG